MLQYTAAIFLCMQMNIKHFIELFTALGLTVEMRSGVGPVFPSPLQTPEDVDTRLCSPQDAVAKLQYVYDAINLTRHQVRSCDPVCMSTLLKSFLVFYDSKRICMHLLILLFDQIVAEWSRAITRVYRSSLDLDELYDRRRRI